MSSKLIVFEVIAEIFDCVFQVAIGCVGVACPIVSSNSRWIVFNVLIIDEF